MKKEDFRKLQQKWYQRLEDEGFEDAEKLAGDTLVLKTDGAHAIYKLRTGMRRFTIEVKEGYFRLMCFRALDESTIYDNDADKHILIRYTEGISHKQIRDELIDQGISRSRNSIRYIIRRYEKAWGIKERLIGHMDSYTILTYAAGQLPKQYEALIFAKWLRSLRFGNDLFRLIDSDSYYKAYHKYIENVLKHPEAIVRLAVLTDDPDVVLGFVVFRGEVLDYCHVHKDNREIGIATKLVPGCVTSFTHLTKTALLIWGNSKKWNKLIFNPFS